MPYYTSRYRGRGTLVDPFRPVGSEQPGWSAIDLRPDPTKLDGDCLLHLPEDMRGPKKIGDDPAPLRDKIAHMLLRPPPRAWKRLMPTNGRYEVWLGGLLWASPVMYGAATDDFNRANETPLASPWFKCGAGSNNINLVSNVVENAAAADTVWYYSGAATTADQYSQAKLVFGGGGAADCGPACRILAAATITCYFTSVNPGNEGIYKFLTGTATQVKAVTTSIANGDTVRLEAQGSTIRYLKNGVEVTNSPATDTNITAAGAGVGLFGFTTYQMDDWAGGDLGQIVLPDADLATGGWTTAPLFSKLNDGSDATLITATAS